MALAVFPTLPGRSVDLKWSPKHFNLPPAITDTGAAITLGTADTPLDDFELVYSFLRDNVEASAYSATEFATMMGFWRSIGGSRGRFLFENPNDNAVTGQSVGTGDGTTTSFGPIMRTYGPAGYSSTEPVGQVNTNKTVKVYLNGVLQGSGYSIDTSAPVNSLLTFTAAPGAGVAITMDFSFYYYCRFSDENMDFNRFLVDFYSLGTVKFESCRGGT